jgi:uncharacterized repeat protein (TIGR01451 family)
MKNLFLAALAVLCLQISTTVQGQSLEVVFDPQMDFASPGEVNPVRVWILNTSSQTAEAASATFTMPAGTSVWGGYFYPSGTPGSGTQTGGDVITIPLGDIPAGGVRVITAPVSVTSGAVVGGTIDWLVDTNYSDPFSASSTVVAEGHLQMAITADKQAIEPGEEFLVTLHLANPGESGVSRAELSGTIADSLEILASSLPEGSVSGNTFSLALGTLPGNTLQQYLLKLRLADDAATPMFHPISASVGGRTDEEFGGATLQVLGLDMVPARTTVVPDWAFRMTTHNYAGSRLEGAILFSHVPKNGSLWAGYARPLANSPTSGTRNAADFPFRWELPDIFSGDAHFIQLPMSSTEGAYARVQRNELVTDTVVIPSDAPFVRSNQRGGDLSLELNAPEPVGPDEEFLFEVRYGNPSDSNTDGAGMLLHLPEEVLIEGSSGPYTGVGNGFYMVELGEIRPGETGTFWMRLRSPGQSPATNQLDFSVWIGDSSFPVKTAFDRLVIQWYEDFPISLNLSSPKQQLSDGALYLAELEITNTDPFPLTDVEVTVSTPANMRFWVSYAHPVPDSGASGTLDFTDPVSWIIPTLDAGETRVISLPWRLNTIPGWWYTLNAVVTTTEGFNGRAQALVTANGQSDLSLFLQSDSASVSPGETFWLTASYTNPGADSALNPSLEVVLPEGLSYVESDIEPVQTEPALRFNFSSMNPADRGRVRIKVAVSSDVEDGSKPVVFAQIRDESLPANAAVAEASLLVEDDNPLQIQVTGHGDPANGGARQVEVLLTNTSSDILEDLVIWVHMPDYFSVDPDLIQPFGGSGGNITSGEKYVYSLETLSPEEPFLLTIPFDTGTPDAGWIAPIVVHATSSEGHYARDFEHNAFNTGNLNVEMIPLSDFAFAGQDLTYRLFVGNKADVERESVVLRASIPQGTTFVSASGGGALTGSSLLWEVGTIPSGSVAFVEYTVSVDGAIAQGSLLQNGAYVSDSESPRNTARAVTAIPVGRTNPRLSLDVDYESSTLTWSLVNNTGTELASARFWYTMPSWLVLADNSQFDARTPVVWDSLNVVSDESQDFVSGLVLVRNAPNGHIAPFTAAARSNQGYGVMRRYMIAITNELYAVDAEGLNPEIRQIWPDAESVEGGWVRSTWYGWFLEEDWPWIIHAEHGYQFPIYNEFGVYLYDFFLGAWIFANQSNYFSDPNFALLYVYDDPDWLPMGFYRGGVAPNRWFYHYGPEFDRAMNESEFRPLLHPDDD